MGKPIKTMNEKQKTKPIISYSNTYIYILWTTLEIEVKKCHHTYIVCYKNLTKLLIKCDFLKKFLCLIK